MSRPKSPATDKENRIEGETKNTVAVLISLALTLFFVLAGMGRAGAIGRFAYQLGGKLFGGGYYLIPVCLFLITLSLAKNKIQTGISTRLAAGGAVFAAAIGIIGFFFPDPGGNSQAAGLIGKIIASPLRRLLGIYSLILLLTVFLVGLFFLFNFSVKFNLVGLLARWRNRRRGALTERNNLLPVLPPSTSLEPIETAAAATSGEKSPAKTGEAEKEKPPAGLFGRIFRPASDGAGRGGTFAPPPLSLLEPDSGRPAAGDIKANANIIKRTLANFGINVEMDEVTIGPSITRYTLKPAEGVKLSRIVALQNDLALALAAHPIRIEAPIPGKSLVGIEIPNSTKSIVGLRSMLASPEFAEGTEPLLVSLGRDITGRPHFGNLARAPHLLVAGATGAGKSVVIHTFITSLLYRNSPERLRLILIDPKRVELTLYNHIPHLLTPVITDAKRSIAVLRWVIKEMEQRYDILENHHVRDIASYQKTITANSAKRGGEGEKTSADKMPYIIIIIDELADIMTVYPRELETVIIRLAQMSRATGIHLILSTQRPSVEIITGLIKANIPTRIALQVASQVDSRTILDGGGAEKLLGSGDMLYLAAERSKPIRLQGAFISEEEVKKVVKHLAQNVEVEEKDDNLGPSLQEWETRLGENLSTPPKEWDKDYWGDGGDDELYEEARQTVIRAGKASASYLQRKLKIGYARAARLLDILEERGVVGPGRGAKEREVHEKPVNGDGE